MLCREGHSLGAVIVTAYTQQFPHRVEHLVLASPAHGKAFHTGEVPPLFRVVAYLWNRGVRAGVACLSTAPTTPSPPPPTPLECPRST